MDPKGKLVGYHGGRTGERRATGSGGGSKLDPSTLRATPGRLSLCNLDWGGNPEFIGRDNAQKGTRGFHAEARRPRRTARVRTDRSRETGLSVRNLDSGVGTRRWIRHERSQRAQRGTGQAVNKVGKVNSVPLSADGN